MSNYNITNIKDLPQLEQILAGNFLVVENNIGTNKLDFADFVIGPTNTSFYSGILSDILSLSSTLISQNTSLSSLSSLVDVLNTASTTSTTAIDLLFSDFTSLCTKVDRYQNSYNKRGLVTVPANSTALGFTVSFNYIINVTNADVIIAPYAVNSIPQPPAFTFSYAITGKSFINNTSNIHIALSTEQVNINTDRAFEYKVTAYENFT